MSEIWPQRIGNQRDWVWRGWQIRYTFKRSPADSAQKLPLILIHGFGAAIEHWRHNIPILSQSYTVYALDLLGFGASRKADTNYSVSLWVQQVYDFWQTFIGEPVVLVGNSVGSLVCLVAAATYPEMVGGIGMLSLPDVSQRQEMIPQWLQPIVTTIEGIFTSPVLLTPLFNLVRRPAVIRRWVGIAYLNQSAITDELVEIIAAPPQDEGAARAFCALSKSVNLPGFCPPAKSILPKLEIPVLLVWGCEDRMVPPILAKKFAALNPKIKLVKLEQAGHCPHDECPERFNDILLEWLESLMFA